MGRRSPTPFQMNDTPKPSMPTNPKDIIGLTKAPLRLVPPAALIECAVVMGLGAKKYGPYNWRDNAVRATVYLEAAMRHILQAADGVDVDPESGMTHYAHAMACMAILIDATHVGNLIDDRHKSGVVEGLLDAVKAGGQLNPEWIKAGPGSNAGPDPNAFREIRTGPAPVEAPVEMPASGPPEFGDDPVMCRACGVEAAVVEADQLCATCFRARLYSGQEVNDDGKKKDSPPVAKGLRCARCWRQIAPKDGSLCPACTELEKQQLGDLFPFPCDQPGRPTREERAS